MTPGLGVGWNSHTHPSPPPRLCPGGGDLAPGPQAAHEAGLEGHGLLLQRVQNPILLKLGDALQEVPGAVAGGHPLSGTLVLGGRRHHPGPALSMPPLEDTRGHSSF